MPNPVAAGVVLDDDERAQLERWTRRRTSAQALAQRARIVLLAAGGLKNTEIADLTTGKVIGALHSRHRAIEFKRFLQSIDRAVSDDLDVHLVLDNSATHKTPAIQKWLAAHPRFVLHFTPTSSSWLNLVERWFAELTTKKLRRGAHKSVRALNADIRAWIETWNDNPRPFVWTKTAEQILESVARYCTRINDSRHLTQTRRSPRLFVGIDCHKHRHAAALLD